MDVLYRMFRTINYNLVLYALAAVAVLYILTSPLVAEPILNFCFAGIVPGTNQVLEPDVMIMGATIALGVLLIILLLAWLIRNRRLHAKPATSAPMASAPVASYPIASTYETSGAQTDPLPAGSLPILLKSLLGTLVGDLQFLFYAGAWVLAQVQLAALRLLRVTTVMVGRMSVGSVIGGQLIFGWLSRRLVATVHWLYPQMRRADVWLERRYRTAVSWLYRKLMRYEIVQIAADILRQARTSLRTFFR